MSDYDVLYILNLTEKLRLKYQSQQTKIILSYYGDTIISFGNESRTFVQEEFIVSYRLLKKTYVPIHNQGYLIR